MTHALDTTEAPPGEAAARHGEAALGEAAARAFAARDHGRGILVEDPATELPLAEVALATARDVDAAVATARHAFADGRWSHLDPVEQEAVLRRLAALVAEHADELAWLEVLDNGKTLAEARGMWRGPRGCSRITRGGRRSCAVTCTRPTGGS